MSSYLTVNGLTVYDAVLTIPRIGCYHCDLSVAGDLPVTTGRVTLSVADGALTVAGVAQRIGTYADYVRLRLVGGLGGFRTVQQQGKSYRNAPLSVPLKDVVAAAGEQLSTFCDAGVLSTLLTSWTNISRKGTGPLVASLLSAVPADSGGRQLAWRLWRLPVTPQNTLLPGTVPVLDGALWVGYEGWPASPLVENVDYVYEYEDAATGRMVVQATELPFLTPGVVFRGRRVSSVRHEFGAEVLCRTTAYYEA